MDKIDNQDNSEAFAKNTFEKAKNIILEGAELEDGRPRVNALIQFGTLFTSVGIFLILDLAIVAGSLSKTLFLTSKLAACCLFILSAFSIASTILSQKSLLHFLMLEKEYEKDSILITPHLEEEFVMELAACHSSDSLEFVRIELLEIVKLAGESRKDEAKWIEKVKSIMVQRGTDKAILSNTAALIRKYELLGYNNGTTLDESSHPPKVLTG